MIVAWDDDAWQQFQNLLLFGNIKDCKKVVKLIGDIQKNGPVKGLGKPERLKHELNDFFSREINKKDRLVYRIENDILQIIQCSSHYENL